MIKNKKPLIKKDKKPSKKVDFSKKMPSLEEMLKEGVHFGHRTSKWNSKMEQ